MDQLVNQAAKIRYMSGGQVKLPLTVLSFAGAGRNAGPQHSGTYDAWLGSIPGLKVATPATPVDAAGMIRGAVRDDDPTIVLLHKALLGLADESDGAEPMKFGEAAVRRKGTDATVVAWSAMVHVALEAAETLAAEGVSVEVVDLRSIQPLDVETIVASVEKTHRLRRPPGGLAVRRRRRAGRERGRPEPRFRLARRAGADRRAALHARPVRAVPGRVLPAERREARRRCPGDP